MGKLIVIEGLDGSGKSTQYALLDKRLSAEGRKYRFIKFPVYEEDSSFFVRKYLQGELGVRPEDVNAYAGSSFFAMDRYLSYKKDWGQYYRAGGVLLCDRYTTSNAYHQGAKLRPEDREHYFKWLYEYEFVLLGLPRPDLVLYLDVPIDMIQKNIEGRNTKRDIHEQNLTYLKTCGETALQAAEVLGWERIHCAGDDGMLPAGRINALLYEKIIETLG